MEGGYKEGRNGMGVGKGLRNGRWGGRETRKEWGGAPWKSSVKIE